MTRFFRLLGLASLILGAFIASAETETLDLKALAKKARPAVMLLIADDAQGSEIARGTGFLVSSDGKLLTNLHVAEGAGRIVAKADNCGTFLATIIRHDAANDIALLHVQGKDLPFLNLGDASKIQAGERVAVIGSPLGLEGTLSEGIVSAIRDVALGQRWLQITAAISPGSSGSPVLNGKGEVIGIASALIREGQSLNFAVPVEVAKTLISRSPTVDELFRASGLKLTPVATAESVIASDPDYKACLSAGEKGENVEALKRAKLLTARYPRNSRAFVELARIYMGMFFDKDAITACRQAIALNPENAEAWFLLGAALRGGDSAEAIDAYQKAIKTKPDFSEAWRNLAWTHECRGEFLQAYSAYKQALDLDPSDKLLIMFLSRPLDSGKDRELISSILPDFVKRNRDAIRKNPQESDDAWDDLELLHEAIGSIARWEDHMVFCEQIITITPEPLVSPMAWRNLVLASERANKRASLVFFCKLRVREKPEDSLAWFALSRAVIEKGDADEVARLIDFLKEQGKASPTCGLLWSTLGEAYKKAGDVDAFVEYCSAFPDNRFAILQLGHNYEAEGDHAMAANAYLRLIKLGGEVYEMAQYWMLLLKLYDRQGESDDAFEVYSNLIKLEPNGADTRRKELAALESLPAKLFPKEEKAIRRAENLKVELELLERYGRKALEKPK